MSHESERNPPLKNKDSTMKNHHTTHDKQILQTLQRSILQTTTFLSSDYTGTELISSNPDPTTIQTLPISTSSSEALKTNTNILLPTTLHPLLNRLYIPHKTFLAEQYHLQKDRNAGKENIPHPAVHEQRFWVGMRLPRRAYPTRDAFLDTLDRSIEMLGANIVVEHPGQAGPPRAFLMEVRGYFRGRLDVLAAAQRHVDLLGQLVSWGYLCLGDVVREKDR